MFRNPPAVRPRVPRIMLSMALSQMPPQHFYWPLEFLASSSISPEDDTPKNVSLAFTNITKVPTIAISTPSPNHQFLQPTLKAVDPSLLHPRYVTSCKSPQPVTPNPKKRKREDRDDYHNLRHAPAPSLFSYDLCRNDSCPINLAHEKGTFRYLGRYLYIDNEKARDLVEKLFGDSNPPRFVWEDIAVIVKTSRESADGSCRKRRQDALECVAGFAKAHFSSGMTEEVVGSLLVGE